MSQYGNPKSNATLQAWQMSKDEVILGRFTDFGEPGGEERGEHIDTREEVAFRPAFESGQSCEGCRMDTLERTLPN